MKLSLLLISYSYICTTGVLVFHDFLETLSAIPNQLWYFHYLWSAWFNHLNGLLYLLPTVVLWVGITLSTTLAFFIEMIDAELYRLYRVGIFNKLRTVKSKSVRFSRCNFGTDYRFYNLAKLLCILMVYIYFVLCLLGLTIGMLLQTKFNDFSINKFYRITDF